VGILPKRETSRRKAKENSSTRRIMQERLLEDDEELPGLGDLIFTRQIIGFMIYGSYFFRKTNGFRSLIVRFSYLYCALTLKSLLFMFLDIKLFR
jgi:hypothetical protein